MELGEEFIVVQLDNGRIVDIEKNTLSHNKQIPFREGGRTVLKYHVAGTMTNYPLKLAWSWTAHKAQGQTLENIYLKLPVFDKKPVEALIYSALSRVMSMEGIQLFTPLTHEDIKVNQKALKWLKSKDEC